jgi:hypothetical protein
MDPVLFNSEKGVSKHRGDMEAYMKDKKFLSAFQGFVDGNETELYSPEGLPAFCRKAWHEKAVEYGFYTMSAGDGACRYVIISKRPFKANGATLLLSPTAQKRFREDFGLKINLTDHEDFEYFVDLYGARPQLNLTLAAIAEFPNEYDFMSYLIKIKKDIWAFIKSNPAYKEFEEANLEPLIQITKQVQHDMNLHSDYLKEKNNGKHYVSIDIRSANFNVFNYFYPGIFNTNSWSDVIQRFADKPATTTYLIESKLFRQKIFWEFNHARQSVLWEFLITNVAKSLHSESSKLNGYHISDEIVFELDVEHNQAWFESKLNELPSIYRVKFFKLEQIFGNQPWLVKRFTDGTFDIKCCSPTDYAIAWKRIHRLPTNLRDHKQKYDQTTGGWVY